MADGGINEDDLRRYKEYNKLRQDASKDLAGFTKNLKGITKIKEQIIFFEKEIEKFQKKSEEFLEKELELKEQIREAEADKNEELLERYRLEEQQLKAKIIQNENNERLAKSQLRAAEEMGAEMAKQVNAANALGAAFGSTGNILKKMGNRLWAQTGYLLQQQKAVKVSELQMGILANRSKDYQTNLYNASLSTNIIGASTKDLAEMQGTYAKEIGRTVLLTEEGHEAMAALSQGTVLGNENAARFAAQMEMFGHSVITSKGFMEETLNVASKMGLAGNKVTENTMEALKVAETFNFKNGVKGAAKMAMLTGRTRIEIESIKKIAETAFNPEGAIELAANLSVLGGTWSQLADPFKLMFKARNDVEGLTEDIAKAASAGAEFNKESGEFEIASVQLQRLREVSNATGISMEELTRSARNAAKFSKIKAQVTGNFDEDTMKFLASTAEMGENGKFRISIDGDPVYVDELHNFTQKQLDTLVKQKATLEERAKQSKTFDETWENLKNQFKATLLPGFTMVAQDLTNGLLKLSDWLQQEDILKKIQDTVTWVGDKVSQFLTWVEKNPIETAVGAAGLGLAYIIGDNAVWFLRGQTLGLGFNSVTAGGMFGGKGTGGGGGGGLFGGGKGGPKYRTKGGVKEIWAPNKKRWVNQAKQPGAFKTVQNSTKWGGKAAGSASKAGGLGKLAGTGGKLLGAAGKLLGVVGTVITVGSIAIDGFKNMQDETLTTGQALKKTADQNKGALIGAVLGGLVGIIGGPAGIAMGAGIGAGLGSMLVDTDDAGLIGDYGQKKKKTPSKYKASPLSNMGQEHQDFVSRPGQKPIPFSSADTLIGLKKGGFFDNTMSKKENKNNLLGNQTTSYTNVVNNDNSSLNTTNNVREYSSIANKNLQAYNSISKNNLTAFSNLVGTSTKGYSSLVKPQIESNEAPDFNSVFNAKNVNKDLEKRINSNTYKAESAIASPKETSTIISKPRQISFNTTDRLVDMKRGGNTQESKSVNEKSSLDKMDVVFKNAMKIEGKITLEGSGGEKVKINMDDPVLLRQLSRLVQEELTISLNGKRNPHPVT
jgi:hypothetical protein